MADSKVYIMVEQTFITPIWHARSIEGLRHAAARQKKPICQIAAPEELDKEPATPNALILIGTGEEWTNAALAACRCRNIHPILIGNMPRKYGENVSGTMYSNYAVMEALVGYFVSHGRCRLALTGLYETSANDIAKKDAFLAIAQKWGLPITQQDVYFGSENFCEADSDFYKNLPAYQGVLCANDFVAAEVLVHSQNAGIRVPEDLFVSGLGDTVLCHYTQPTLTSATRAYEETGDQAFSIWKQLNANPRLSSVVITVDCEIKPRGSTANAPLPKSLPTATEYIASQIMPYRRLPEDNARDLVNCLTQCSQMDMQIIQSILQGKSLEQTAEDLIVSTSTVRYRLRKIYTWAGVPGKTAFISLFRRYISGDRIFSDFCQEENQ